MKNSKNTNQPSVAFIGASWAALVIGFATYIIGLWNTESFALSQKGYYFAIIMYGLFAVISVQKSVRDRLEGIPVTPVYYGLAWLSTVTALVLLVVGLWNATNLDSSQKGFFGMSFLLSLFAAIAVQKNTRDMSASDNDNVKVYSSFDKTGGEA